MLKETLGVSRRRLGDQGMCDSARPAQNFEAGDRPLFVRRCLAECLHKVAAAGYELVTNPCEKSRNGVVRRGLVCDQVPAGGTAWELVRAWRRVGGHPRIEQELRSLALLTGEACDRIL